MPRAVTSLRQSLPSLRRLYPHSSPNLIRDGKSWTRHGACETKPETSLTTNERQLKPCGNRSEVSSSERQMKAGRSNGTVVGVGLWELGWTESPSCDRANR